MTFDLLIRNGTLVDGSGMPRYRADVGVSQGRIAEIGRISSPAAETIDAEGMIVAPGFIDGHTHMDAQVAWDPAGTCSCWHGVTTVVMGNCGFALAPCKPEAREWFAECLEAVEDIPKDAMVAGIDWRWETFPEYLAAVESFPKAINYAAYIGHSALRMYAMGDRALDEEAGEDDLRLMADLVQEALRAGAVGFSSSRSNTHIRPDGGPGGEPHRELGGDRAPGGRDGRAQRRHLPDRARRLRRRSAARLPGRADRGSRSRAAAR